MSSATESTAAASFDGRSAAGTPTWEVARFYPTQGDWTEEEYLVLCDKAGTEYNAGHVEFLPMPTKTHQLILQFLYRLLDDFVRARQLGHAFVMGYRVRTLPKKLREPDVFYVANERETTDACASGCDLAIEIVSPEVENRDRDLLLKRSEYAAAGIPEYWIVDPESQTVTVLTLPDGARQYAVHGEFQPGETATSVLLEGFSVDVTTCFDFDDER